MKIRIFELLFFTFCAIMLVLLFLPEQPREKVAHETTLNHIAYEIKDFNGKIAVFENDREMPIQVYDVFTKTLPEEDAIRIEKGILVFTMREVEKILDEYLS